MKSFFQFLKEAVEGPAQQAARLGLEGDGHGGWYKNGEFVAKTVGGQLKFYNKRQRVGKDPKQSEKEKNISSPTAQAPQQPQAQPQTQAAVDPQTAPQASAQEQPEAR
jgi:hypothetical protein